MAEGGEGVNLLAKRDFCSYLEGPLSERIA